MDPEKIQPVVSAKIPVLRDTAKKMIEMLDNGASYDELFVTVKVLAKEWETQDHVAHAKVVALFEDRDTQEYKDLRVLFHTIHRQVLRSLLLGTLPYDLHDKDHPNWKYIYEGHGAGAYLIGLSINGRRGAFLNREEIEVVIGHLQDYKEGCEAWMKIKGSYDQEGLTDEEQSSLRKALDIDNTVLRENQEWDSENDKFIAPKCLSGRKGTSNIQALIEMLRRRVNPALDGQAPQLSSPVYIGCGMGVASRMIQHDPDFHSMDTSSHVLRLLISCIRYSDLKLLVHGVPIIMVWDVSQIASAEVLVTVLAQSLISMNGLNVIQPGTNTTRERKTSVYDEMRKHVWVKRPWFEENIRQSLGARENRDIYKSTLQTINTNFKTSQELKDATGEVHRLRSQAQDHPSMAADAMEHIKERTRRAEEHLEKLKELSALAPGIFPDKTQQSPNEDED
ncbi:hypothetical protein F4811DRAFT_558879 [Daldinia bambusicola]|nr:hypothetical protein F4811DRAFT_558879 [Daldinia bambusicola]